MNTVKFEKPVVTELVKARTATVASIQVGTLTDDPQTKRASVIIMLLDAAGKVVGAQQMTLWTGKDYDAAGAYSEADIAARVQALAAIQFKA